MAGEEGSSEARTTRSGTKRAAEAAVSGGEKYVLTRCHHAPMEKSALRSCTTTRKAEESVRATKRKAAAKGAAASKGEEEAPAKKKGRAKGAAASKGVEEAPAKKKGRLPQEEIDYILARKMDDNRLPRSIRELKHRNPELIPSPEEQMDEELMDLYEEARLIYKFREDIRKCHAWVRSEYHKKGYVEVEDDILVRLEKTKVWEEEFRAELAAGTI